MPRKGLAALAAARAESEAPSASAASSAPSANRRVLGKRRGGDDQPSDAAGKRLKPCPEGVARCLRCQETSEVKTWATQRVTKQGNVKKNIPVGNACHDCYAGYNDMFADEWESFEEMVAACSQCRETKARVDGAYNVYQHKQSLNIDRREVGSLVECRVQVDREYIVLNDRELKAELGVARLNKGVTRGLRTLSIPCEADPSTNEDVYVFVDPNSRFRKAKVSAICGMQEYTEKLTLDRTYHEMQGRYSLRKNWLHEQANAVGLLTAQLSTLGEFINHKGVPGATGAGVGAVASAAATAEGDADEGDDDDESELVGIGAVAAAKAAGTPGKSKRGAVTSPAGTKMRPPVPPFSAGASSAASARASPSKPASVVEGGGEDEDDAEMSLAGSADGDECAHGDWVSHWKARLPLEKVITGPPKGRTIAALKGRVAKLAEKDVTADMSNRLKNYLGLVTMAEQLRLESVMKVPRSELEVILKAMKAENVSIPVATHTALVEHRIAALVKGDSAPNLILSVMRPWPKAGESTELDILNPDIGRLDSPLEVRVEMFRRCFWRQFVSPMLMGDLSAKDRLLTIVRETDDVFSAEDPVDLDTTVAALAFENVLACRGIVALMTMPTDPEYEPALTALKARATKSDKSVLTCVASAVCANTTLNCRLDILLKAMPVFHEHGPAVKEIEAGLVSIGCDFKAFELLLQACRLVCKINSSHAAELFDNFGTVVSDALKAAWGKFTSNPKEPLDPDVVRAAEKTFSEAVIAFSMDDKIVEMQAQVAQKLREADSMDRPEALLKSLTTGGFVFDFGSADVADSMAKANRLCKGVAGMDLTPEAKQRLREVFLGMLEGVAKLATEKKEEGSQKACAGIDLLQVILDTVNMPTLAEVPTILKSAADVRSSMVAYENKADADGKDNGADDGLCGVMQELTAQIKIAESGFNTLEAAGLEEGAIKNMMGIGQALLKDASRIAGTFYEKLVEQRMGTLRETLAALDGLVNKHKKDGKWYGKIAGTSDKAWADLKKVSDEIIGKLSMQGFEKSLSAVKLAIEQCNSASELLIGEDPKKQARLGEIEKANEARKSHLVMYCELQLIFALVSDFM